MKHEIYIPNWRPATLNRLKDNRWVSGKLKAADRHIVAGYVRINEVPPPAGRRKVSLRMVLGKGQRAPDGDAFWKSLMDALKHAGAIKDDSREWAIFDPEVEYVRSHDGTHATTIILEDVEPAPQIRRLKKGEAVR